jgi:capsular polysaccharide biosynthesis protein
MTEILTQTPNPPRSHSDEISLADIVGFFRRNLVLIFGLAMTAGIVTVLVIFAFVKRSYEASAVLVIVPPKLKSELMAGSLTVQGYQKLLESDAVVTETKKRLVAQGALMSDDRLELGREIEARIFVSRKAEETSLAPMLQVVARAKTPANAALTANTWAEVFLEQTRDLMRGSTSSTVQFVEQQYPQARQELVTIENERVSVANACQLGQDEAANRWDERLTAYKNESQDLMATYRAESKRLFESLTAERNFETKKTQLESLRKAYGDLQNEQVRVKSLLQQKTLERDAARTQLAQTQQFLTLRKGISDEVMWEIAAGTTKQEFDWTKLAGKNLVGEQLNPEFTELRGRLSATEIDLNALTPRAAQLQEGLVQQAEAISRFEADFRKDSADLEKLQREREAGLAKLLEERANQLTMKTRARQEELDRLKRECDTKLGQIDRDITQKKDLFGSLAKNFNQALMAKAQEDVEDVRLGAPAALPDRPKARGTVTKALLASILAGFLGIAIALIREVGASPRS